MLEPTGGGRRGGGGDNGELMGGVLALGNPAGDERRAGTAGSGEDLRATSSASDTARTRGGGAGAKLVGALRAGGGGAVLAGDGGVA